MEQRTRGARAWRMGLAGAGAIALMACDPGKLTDANAIAVGGFHSCAVRRDGTAVCWGSNAFGQLGDGQSSHQQCGEGVDCSEIPLRVASLAAVLELRAGLEHTCARTDSQVFCWGANESGQTGSAASPLVATPTPVANLGGVQQLALGAKHTCAVDASHAVLCWGSNAFGQLGNPAAGAASATPTGVLGLPAVSSVAAGASHTCALAMDGTVWCWGDGSLGQLGNDAMVPSEVPLRVSGIADAVEISAGGSHTCARRADGRVACWGLDSHGELGDGDAARAACSSGAASVDCSPTPVQVLGLSDAAELAAGASHTCARRASGVVLCWGSNARGQLGDLSSTHATCADGVDCSRTPVAVSSIADASGIGAGGDHACALRPFGDVLCWGDNAEGQLGSARGTHAMCGGQDCSYAPVSVAGIR